MLRHKPPYLSAIRQFQKLTPDCSLLACLETAFHQNHSAERYSQHGILMSGVKYGIRRLGYHEASHEYISDTVAEKYGSQEKLSCRFR